jgi:signal transduction histidine kinase
MRKMNEFVSNVTATGVRTLEDRTDNFRSNAIETLRWYCSEKKPDEISLALRELFSTTPNCSLIRCEVIFLGDETVPEREQATEDDLQYLSATKMPFYSEVSDNVSSLVQFCINGSSIEGGSWQVRVQLSVKGDSELVWQTILNDICVLPDGFSDRTDELPRARPIDSVNPVRLPDGEEELGYQAMTSELIHELRNPLGSIMTSVGMVIAKDDEPLDSEDRKLLAIIEAEAERFDSTLQKFSELLKPVNPQKSEFDLIDLLRDTVEDSTFLSGTFSDIVELSHPCEGDSLVVDADFAMFRSVLVFMLQHLPESVAGCKSAHVRCVANDDSIVVKFEYGGDGIRPDLLRKVVLPFDSTREGGSGLASIPVHRIITAHEGGISIDSSETATVITMTVPRYRE